MSVPVHFSPRALAQAQAAHAWWKKYRPRAPRLFRDELAEGLLLLRTNPKAGVPYPHRRLPDVRRLLLRRSQVHLYYVIGSDGVRVVAVWSTRRGRAPPLRDSST